MTNKDIHLSLSKQNEISVKKLLTNHKLEKEYTYKKMNRLGNWEGEFSMKK